MATCAEACAEALAECDPAGIDDAVVTQLYALPDLLREQLPGFHAHCTDKLLAELGSAHRTLLPPKLGRFIRLPFGAAVALLSSDQLRVMSENDVLVGAAHGVWGGCGRIMVAAGAQWRGWMDAAW